MAEFFPATYKRPAYPKDDGDGGNLDRCPTGVVWIRPNSPRYRVTLSLTALIDAGKEWASELRRNCSDLFRK